MSQIPSWQYRIPSISFFHNMDELGICFSVASYERDIYNIVTRDGNFEYEELEPLFDSMTPLASANDNFSIMTDNICEYLSNMGYKQDIIDFIMDKCMEPIPRKWTFEFEYHIWPILRNALMDNKIRRGIKCLDISG